MARCSGRASRTGGKVWERLQREHVTGLVQCTSLVWVWAWAAEGKDGWEKFGQEAFEMGLRGGLLGMPFCDEQGLQGLGLHSALVLL